MFLQEKPVVHRVPFPEVPRAGRARDCLPGCGTARLPRPSGHPKSMDVPPEGGFRPARPPSSPPCHRSGSDASPWGCSVPGPCFHKLITTPLSVISGRCRLLRLISNRWLSIPPRTKCNPSSTICSTDCWGRRLDDNGDLGGRAGRNPSSETHQALCSTGPACSMDLDERDQTA